MVAKKLLLAMCLMLNVGLAQASPINLACTVKFSGDPVEFSLKFDSQKPFWVLLNGAKIEVEEWRITDDFIKYSNREELTNMIMVNTISRSTGNITVNTIWENGSKRRYVGKCESKRANKF